MTTETPCATTLFLLRRVADFACCVSSPAIWLASIWLAVGSSIAWAQAPALLPVHGVLNNEQGERVDSPVNVTFSLYTQASGGMAFHTETLAVSPENGVFTAYLGTNVSLDLENFRTEEIYLGVEIEDDGEMTPRFRIGTTAFAAFAEFSADSARLSGFDASDFASNAHGHSWTDLTGVPTGLSDGDDVLTRATVESYARSVCYDTPTEITGALPDLDTNAQDDLTVTTSFGGDVQGTASNLRLINNSVSSAEVIDGTITTNDLRESVVTTSKINDSAVTTSKIAPRAVTRAQIGTDAAGANEVSLPIGSMSVSRTGGYSVGVNYLFSGTTYRPTQAGRCLLMAAVSIQNVLPLDRGVMRVNVGYRIGASGTPVRIGPRSTGAFTVTGSVDQAGSNHGTIAVNANATYYFGCAIEIDSSGSSLTDNAYFCSAHWICT